VRRQRAWAGTLGVLLACLAVAPATDAPSFASEPTVAARVATLPPEFSGTVTLTFDVSASESTSDLTPGHYDTSHLFGTVTLRPREGSVSALFDAYLFSATSALDVTSTMARYAPQGPCQDYVFQYAPASGYPGYPAYFGMQTPETGLIHGYRWGIDIGAVVGAQSNGCAGQDGNWPIVKFDELVEPFVRGAVSNDDQHGGRLHLSGTKIVSMSSPAVVRHNKNACSPDGVYATFGAPCITSLDIRMDYDLTRISPDRAASQYPRLVLRNDRHGNDRVEVRTDTAVRNTKVVVYQVKPGSPVMQSVGSPTTNRKGIVRFTLKDRQKSERRWFIAYVAGTGRVLPGVSPTGSVL
jgi:hypothetical protein